MKRLSVVFAFLLVGIFLFSFGFVNADCGHCDILSSSACNSAGSYFMINYSSHCYMCQELPGQCNCGTIVSDQGNIQSTKYFCDSSCTEVCNPDSALVGCTQSCGPFPGTLNSNLISYWPFDIATGSNATFAKDIVHNNNGASSNVALIQGFKGQAYTFSSNADVVIDNEQNFDFSPSSSITLSAWIYNNHSRDLGFYKAQTAAPASSNFGLNLDPSAGNINFGFYSSSFVQGHPWSPVDTYADVWIYNFNTFYTHNPILNNSKWDNVVVTFNYSDCASMKIYINGVLNSGSWGAVNWPHGSLCAGPYPCDAAGYCDIPPAPVTNNNPVHFSSSSGGLLIDEIAIWNRSLNSSEVAQLYNYYVPSTALNKPFFSSLNQPNVNISSSNVGDTVLMRFPGVALTGKTINYSINVYNASGAVWWNPFSYFSKAWDSSQKILGDAYEPFTLTQTNLHRFNASIVGTNQWNMSNNLTVSSVVNNSLPIAIINSPANDSKVQSGSLVWFNQSSTDEDDLLNITWDFGDGSTFFLCPDYAIGLDVNKCNIRHAYANKGIYLVKLTATEMVRGQSSQQMMLVYVFSSGINVVPIISNPKFGISYGNFVDFDASGSYVANCSTTSLIRDFPQVGNLNCTYLHAPNTPSSNVLNGYNLIYSWNMGGSSLVGNWSSYNSAVVFKYYFAISGVHNSKLNLTYTY